jgi:hypothetical protein
MLGKFITRMGRMTARAGELASRHQVIGLRLLYAGAFALVVLLVHRELFSFIAQRRQFFVPDLKTALAPKWADRQGEEIVRIEGAGKTLFDGDLVERVGKAFESCAWVRKVTAVERLFPDQIRVRFEYRQAHVAVRRENGFVLVDRDGVRLPGVYVNPPACDRPVISGVVSRPPEPGKAWEDDSLRAAVAMADFINNTALLRRLAIKEVDVANHGGRQDGRRSEMSLVTSNGCVLAWGRAASMAKFGDPSPEEKLAGLGEVLAAYPDLNGLKRVTLGYRGSRAVELGDPYVRSGPR